MLSNMSNPKTLADITVGHTEISPVPFGPQQAPRLQQVLSNSKAAAPAARRVGHRWEPLSSCQFINLHFLINLRLIVASAASTPGHLLDGDASGARIRQRQEGGGGWQQQQHRRPAGRRPGAHPGLPTGAGAVRTCVLARRWRHLWRSAPALRFGCLDGDGQVPPPVREHHDLVDRLLLLRGGGGPQLDTCDIRLGESETLDDVDDDDVTRVNFWVWHAVAACKFRLHIDWHFFLQLDDRPLVSQHLTRLHLRGVSVHSSFSDFSGCPALEHLDLVTCGLYASSKISSDSLKHLNITECSFSEDHRMSIHAPSLVSLLLDRNEELTPMLGSMPSLLEAFVRMGELSGDYCFKLCDEPELLQPQDCLCQFCVSSSGGDGKSCGLFKGLSEAKSLVLISAPSSSVSLQSPRILFKWELRWCPVFSKLKTLVLNEYWCMPDEFGPLVCILEHAPVLEELTLVLFSEGPKYEMEMKGSTNPMERPATISEHLNTVKVKCQAVDERVLKVLKFLSTLNISFTS
ncbi:hypothetical protein U9M48_004734 [Paspalum notatum var. saurae]|uniref:Uncharacterized protein n=1 Tax=Paspalum notatum var. saurae TaxID=547442 RepID=A0AAQ3PPA6_PASNO